MKLYVEAMDATLKKFGGLDILVNNAGIFNGKGVEDATMDEWHNLVAVNLPQGCQAGAMVQLPLGGGTGRARAVQRIRHFDAPLAVARCGAKRIAARIGFVDRDVGDHPPGACAHHHDAARQVNRFVDAVGDEDGGEAEFLPHPQGVVVELEARHLVERGEGFVHQEQLGTGHHGARNGDAHLHAAGKFARIHLREGCETHVRQRSFNHRACLGTRHALQSKRQPHVIEHRCPRHQGRFLEHETQLVRMIAAGWCLRPVDAAGGDWRQARDHAQRSALAAARGAQETHELALADGKRQALERLGAVGVTLLDLLQANQVTHAA